MKEVKNDASRGMVPVSRDAQDPWGEEADMEWFIQPGGMEWVSS